MYILSARILRLGCIASEPIYPENTGAKKGVFKMIVSFFSNLECEGSVKCEIRFFDKSVQTEAFVDSGNLAIDPMDMRPVLFIKKEVAQKLFPESVIELKDPDSLDKAVIIRD